MNICVFCSANDVDEAYVAATRRLGELIAERKYTYVYGGADKGLMKVIADVVERAGGTIVGISFELLRSEVRQGSHELIMERDLAARKARIVERSDAFVVLPGGLGTFDEVTEVLELKKHRLHKKPIVVLNTNGFYDGLQQQLERMHAEGFLPVPLAEMITFVATPEAAMEYIEAHV